MTNQQAARRLSCPECGEPMLKIPGKEDEQHYFLCGCCGGEFWPQVADPYAGLAGIVSQECGRGDKTKGGSGNRGGRFGKKKPTRKRDSVREYY